MVTGVLLSRRRTADEPGRLGGVKTTDADRADTDPTGNPVVFAVGDYCEDGAERNGNQPDGGEHAVAPPEPGAGARNGCVQGCLRWLSHALADSLRPGLRTIPPALRRRSKCLRRSSDRAVSAAPAGSRVDDVTDAVGVAGRRIESVCQGAEA